MLTVVPLKYYFIRDLEDTIEKTINDKPKSTQHVYAAEITQHTNVSFTGSPLATRQQLILNNCNK